MSGNCQQVKFHRASTLRNGLQPVKAGEKADARGRL
jgi:hypothetical protein